MTTITNSLVSPGTLDARGSATTLDTTPPPGGGTPHPPGK